MEYLWLIMMCLCVYANNPDILSAAVSLKKMKSCSGDTLTNTHEVKYRVNSKKFRINVSKEITLCVQSRPASPTTTLKNYDDRLV